MHRLKCALTLSFLPVDNHPLPLYIPVKSVGNWPLLVEASLNTAVTAGHARLHAAGECTSTLLMLRVVL